MEVQVQESQLRIVTAKAITPSAAESKVNPRSRSAKLRVAQKIEASHA
jgi:16S rRNA C1402 N4-methylase RsmH